MPIDAAATHDDVSWTCTCGLSTGTSEAFECHLVDQARDASATLHGRVPHQRPTSAQHSVLFDPNNHLTPSTDGEPVDVLGHDDDASMDAEATAAIKAAPAGLRQHGCQMGTDSLSTTVATRRQRSEPNHRSVLNRARGRHVSTLATIDDTADLERVPDGAPLRHDRDHAPAWHDQTADSEHTVQDALDDVRDPGGKAVVRDEVRNLMPSAAERHRAHQPMTTTDADSHHVAPHDGESLLGGVQPTVVHLTN